MDQQSNPTSKRKQLRIDLYFPNIGNYRFQDVEVDNSAACSSISQGYLNSIGWKGKQEFVDDGHVCDHHNARRVVLTLGYDRPLSRGGTFDVTFCLLEMTEKVAIMSANEHFWVTCPKRRPKVVAPIMRPQKTKVQKKKQKQINAEHAERARQEVKEQNKKDREAPPEPKPGADGKKPNNQGAEGSQSGTK